MVEMVRFARNSLGIFMKYANEVYWDKMSYQTLKYFPGFHSVDLGVLCKMSQRNFGWLLECLDSQQLILLKSSPLFLLFSVICCRKFNEKTTYMIRLYFFIWSDMSCYVSTDCPALYDLIVSLDLVRYGCTGGQTLQGITTNDLMTDINERTEFYSYSTWYRLSTFEHTSNYQIPFKCNWGMVYPWKCYHLYNRLITMSKMIMTMHTNDSIAFITNYKENSNLVFVHYV